jgi:PAS domain S-box-containing protein
MSGADERRRSGGAPPSISPAERRLLDALGEAVIVTDLEGTIVYWNPCAERLYGWKEAEAVGRRIVDVTPAAMAREHAAEILANLGRGEAWAGDFPVQRRDGSTFTARVTTSPYLDEHGRLVGIVGISQDVTRDQQRVEAALELAEAQRRRLDLLEERRIYEILYRLGTSLATELDEEKLIQLVTDEATSLTGADFGSFFFNVTNERGEAYMLYTLSGAPKEAFAGFPLPRATPLFAQTFRGEGVVRSDDVRKDPRYGAWGPQPKGHLPVVSYLAVPVITRAGEVLGGLFFGHREAGRFTEAHERIVTGLAGQSAVALENARLYARIRQSEARARDADRRKDEFLAMLGHELRNPLAPIVTALHLLELRGQRGRELDVIERQVHHLVQLVDDLLDVSRITRGRIQLQRAPIEVTEVVARAIEMASPLVEQRAHHLAVEVPPVGLRVDGDATRLAQVLSNLLTNAAKYTDPGGNIAIAARREGSRVTIAVRDDGAGIQADVLPSVFEAFVQGPRTLDRAGGGLGIGLMLVRSLVELHGGSVEARSDGPGKGSEFTVRLPAVADPAPRAAAPGEMPAPPEAPRRGLRILVVDDNADAAETLADALRAVGYAVATAGDGPAALRAAGEHRPDVALLDIGLPVMDGYELAQRLRELLGSGTRFLALTGYGQPEDRARTERAGFEAHFVKPVDLRALEGVLRRGA